MNRWYEMVFAVLIAGLAVGCDATETETDEVLPEPDTTAAPIEDADDDAELVPDDDLADPEPGDAALIDPTDPATDPLANEPAVTEPAETDLAGTKSSNADPENTNSESPEPANPNLAEPPQTQQQDGASESESTDSNSSSSSSDKPVEEEPADSIPNQNQDDS